MTKKKNLTAFMIAIIVMLFSLPANAQGKKGYAKWDENSNTLTFYGGESVPAGASALNTDSIRPAWNNSVARNSCTKVVFDASFNDVRPTSCYFWFQGFSKLSTIEGIGYLNTDNVTNMSYMFYNCSKLTSTSLDVSKFNTANVTDMSYMFR
ncbi:MAG: BspA family leucine-rich repeat surface protein, partial [Prevotella sp.]|nr:BspA family leucine-rich repeat surface protein [Prevotella sp.]